jgi:hypothetical protein
VFRAYIVAGCPHGASDIARGSLIFYGYIDPGPSPDPISAEEFQRMTRWHP